MRRTIVAVMAGLVLGGAGVLVAQQEYPNLASPEVVLDNEHVVVQRIEFEPGGWSGEHSHAGNQLVVIMDDFEMTYKDEGGETTRSFKAGDVFWVDAVTHDHQAMGSGTGVLITIK